MLGFPQAHSSATVIAPARATTRSAARYAVVIGSKKRRTRAPQHVRGAQQATLERACHREVDGAGALAAAEHQQRGPLRRELQLAERGATVARLGRADRVAEREHLGAGADAQASARF